MRVTRITLAWLAALVTEADEPISDLVTVISDGDTAPPDRISIVVSEESDPVAPPLHLYDLEIEIRTPAASDFTADQTAAVDAWLDSVFADDPDEALVDALEGIGSLNDWFVGKATRMQRFENASGPVRTVRLAIVHA
jgi:hypothetical protein